MKILLIGLLALGSFSALVHAEEMNAFDCFKKAEYAAYSTAQLELGDDCVVTKTESNNPFSTEIRLSLTVRQSVSSSTVTPKELVYEVTTVDSSKSDRCTISSVVLKK